MPRRAACVLAMALAWSGVGGVSRANAAPPARDGGAPELVQPRLRNEVKLEYPSALLGESDPPSGTVLLRFVVGVDGVPAEIEIVDSVHPLLDARAKAAVADLRYDPGTYDGKPVEVVLSTAIEIVPPVPRPEAEAETTPATEGTEKTRAGSQVDRSGGLVVMQGVVLEAGQRTAVAGASVLAVPAPEGVGPGRIRKTIYEEPAEPAWQVETVTDAEGHFELRGIPSGLVRIIVLEQDFERLDFVEEIPDDGVLDVKYFQRRAAMNPYRTVVEADAEAPEVTRRTITPQEITNLPGTQGDALKAITNFPGVARPPFGIGLLVIRGSAPTDSRTYLGYHEIPQLFHFGAITSVFNSDILAQIDFIPGNFDSRFGDAIGGIINVQPRKGRRDGYHGYIDSDIFDTGILLEGPVGKGSFILSARRSYIDAILRVAIPDDANVDFEVAPRYWDYQALLDYPVGDGELSVRIFGSDDRLDFIAPEVNETGDGAEDGLGTSILFHRADLVYTVRKGSWHFLITPAYRHDFFGGQGFGIFQFSTTLDTFSFRAEASHQFSRRAALRFGTEMTAGKWSIDARAPPIPNFGEGDSGEEFSARLSGSFADPAIYATATLAPGENFTFFPGVRLHYYAVLFEKMAVDPRVRFAWQIAPSTTVKGGVGTFTQVPDVFEFNEVWGNPGIGLERATHTSFGVAHTFDDIGLSIEATAFYKYLWALAVPSAALRFDKTTIMPERFSNDGFGHVVGGEFLIRKQLTKNFFGWVSYTLSKALYQLDPTEGLVPFDFDQPHILTAIAVYRLPRQWQIGGRFRLVSGNPQTPIIGAIYDSQNGEYVPIFGETNSDRLRVFHQLDVRVDKTWIWRYLSLSLYLDIQNIYNRRNPEGRSYSFNFQQFNELAGLPIIPSLGLKLAF